MKFSKLTFSVICSIFLIGCGGGSSDSVSLNNNIPANPTDVAQEFATIAGIVGYNPMANSDILAYDINGNLLTRTVTDAMGEYSMQIENFNTPVIIRVPQPKLVAAIPETLKGDTQTVYITEFTTLIYEAALEYAAEANEPLTTESLKLMYETITNAFKFNPLITDPRSADYTSILTVMNLESIKNLSATNALSAIYKMLYPMGYNPFISADFAPAAFSKNVINDRSRGFSLSKLLNSDTNDQEIINAQNMLDFFRKHAATLSNTYDEEVHQLKEEIDNKLYPDAKYLFSNTIDIENVILEAISNDEYQKEAVFKRENGEELDLIVTNVSIDKDKYFWQYEIYDGDKYWNGLLEFWSSDLKESNNFRYIENFTFEGSYPSHNKDKTVEKDHKDIEKFSANIQVKSIDDEKINFKLDGVIETVDLNDTTAALANIRDIEFSTELDIVDNQLAYPVKILVIDAEAKTDTYNIDGKVNLNDYQYNSSLSLNHGFAPTKYDFNGSVSNLEKNRHFTGSSSLECKNFQDLNLTEIDYKKIAPLFFASIEGNVSVPTLAPISLDIDYNDIDNNLTNINIYKYASDNENIEGNITKASKWNINLINNTKTLIALHVDEKNSISGSITKDEESIAKIKTLFKIPVVIYRNGDIEFLY